MHWFIDPIKNKYADFEGRASREEFWMYILIAFLLSMAVSAVSSVIGFEVLSILFSLAILLPGISITARRLHDTGLSGWWQLIGLIPLVGLIILIVLTIRDSEVGSNKYGPSPKESVFETSSPAATETRAQTSEEVAPETQNNQSENPEANT